jgi:quinol monooxygenase YgiN
MKSHHIATTLVLGGALIACSSDTKSGTGNEESTTSDIKPYVCHPLVASSEFTAEDGEENAIKAALQEIERQTAREAGVLYSNVHQSVDDPKQFLALGVWCDESAFQAHGAAPYAAAFFTSVSSMLAAPPKTRIFATVGSPDLGPMNATARDPDAVYTYVVAQTTTKAAKDHVMSVIPSVIPVSRAQSGARFYDILDPSEPTTFASYESWASASAEQAHLASAPINAFLASVTADLGGPPLFRHYKSIAAAAAAE